MTSNNEKIENPRHLKQCEYRLKNLQRSISVKEKGSNGRSKTKRLLTRVYEKLTNQRADFLHKTSRWLVNKNDLIVHEDLNIKGMQENSKFNGRQKRNINRSINDVCWNKFIAMVTYKAEDAGKYIVAVSPENTSKTCSLCGNINEKLQLKDRVYKCSQCGITLDRDYNASCNILRLGTSQFGSNTKKPMCFSHR